MRRRRWVAIAACAAWLSLALAFGAVVPAGVAYADCSGAGDFGAGSGCPPPGDTSGSGGGESWPPTSVDWPPSQGDSGGGGGSGSGSGSGPIVMPDGQQIPSTTRSTSAKDTFAPPTPIVPVDAPPNRPSTTAIVPAASGD